MKDFFEKASNFELNKSQIEIEKLRQEFIRKFDINKLNNMTIDEYSLNKEKGDKDNFCYWVETRLNGLGDIHGNTSFKFGVYFGNIKGDYTYKWRWAKWTNENFEMIRTALLNLYDAGKREDIEAIKENQLSNMFKGKILSIYFPNRYLNIFADYHLKYFFDRLNIYYKNDTNPIELREKLIEYKNSNSVTASWTAIKFGYYLYNCFGKPSEKEINDAKEIENKYYDDQLNFEINNAIITNQEIKKYADIPVIRKEKIETPIGMTYKRDKDKSIQALQNANYLCEVDSSHESFLRRDGKNRYMEAHHLIPMGYQDFFENTLDTPANIVSLCSNCHNLIHYGLDYEKILEELYQKRKNRLKEVGLEITFSQLKEFYK